MPYSSLDIAKWFINAIDRESGESISHLKIQKLLYYAAAWSRLLTGKDLFNERIEAWAHGPVVPEVFKALKQYGWEAIPPQALDTEFDQDTTTVLKQVLDVYGEFSAKTLERMTHADRPWIEARGDLAPETRCENEISKDSIAEFFTEKFGEYLSESLT